MAFAVKLLSRLSPLFSTKIREKCTGFLFLATVSG
jgi:hypothetical protein